LSLASDRNSNCISRKCGDRQRARRVKQNETRVSVERDGDRVGGAPTRKSAETIGCLNQHEHDGQRVMRLSEPRVRNEGEQSERIKLY